MKKTIILLLLFIFSCSTPCCAPEKYRIMGIRLCAVCSEAPEYIPDGKEYDILDTRIYFRADADLEYVFHSISFPSTIDRANAFQPGEEYLNHFLSESVELRFDTPIVFKGKTIEPGDDILAVPQLRQRFEIDIQIKCIRIISDYELIHEIEFGSDEFKATMTCMTDDKLTHSASVDIMVRKKTDA